MKRSRPLAVLLAAFFLSPAPALSRPPFQEAAGAAANRAGKPTPGQLAWHELELEMFVCLDPCTWQDREYDDHSTPLSEIDPRELDADQWCRAALSFGAKQILFVAKHTGGFCWWQTETSEYSIRNTPYKNGEGDVLGELAEACRRHNLKLAVYVYPGDDQWGAPIGSGGRTSDPARQEAYNEVYRRQLTEVLTRYGPISEVWFDGSCVIEVGDILERYAPEAMIFQGPHATLRWPGNEQGFAPDPAWQTVSAADAATGVATARHSDPDGEVWLPMEMDTPLLDHKWFWGRNTDSQLKSVERLMEIYYKSVGRGGVLLLNSTPDTRGLIPETHLARYREFGEEIRRRFGKSLAEASGSGDELELVFPAPTTVNHTILMEDIANGHTIRAYAIEGLVDGAWQPLVEGTSVGHEKIDCFPSATVSRLRLRITDARGTPVVRRLAAFDVTLQPGAYPELRPEPPANVILILADDVGVEAFGCYGGTSYETPRLDRLAAGGMRFTHAYSQTLCTPSRVKLMTGRGNLRNYVHFSILDPEERTFGDLAREAGYATVVVGKWQLLGARQYGQWAGRGTKPRHAGFDRWCLWQVSRLGSRYGDPTIEVDGELREKLTGSYGPDLFCDFLLEFVAEHVDEPFLAYYPMALVHDPFERTPSSPEGERSEQECFGDMVEYMDAIVGRIEDRLEELGLRERTLLLFVGDNGTDQRIRSRMGEREVRGGKRLSTDAGTHVPLIASWPGKISPGGVCDDLVDLSDFLPTLAEVMGAELPPEPAIDGRSFLPQLLGRPGNPREVLTIYSNPRPGEGRNPRVCFARDKRYKLYDDGRLYDTVEDPLEERPLEEGRKEIRDRLQCALDELPEEPEHLREG